MLKFGDPSLIIENYKRNTPYLKEIIHECNCDHCQMNGEIEGFKCSMCGYSLDDIDRFEYDDPNGEFDYKCPRCKKLLYDNDTYDIIINNKRRAYETLNPNFIMPVYKST